MYRLSKEEKKLISLIGITVLLLILFVVFVYNPKRKAVNEVRQSVEVREAEIREIKSMIGEDVTLEEGVDILKQKAKNLKAKYIRQRDLSLALKILSDAANMAGIRIISTNLQTLSVFTNPMGVTPAYGNDVCKKMTVSLVIEGKYEALGRYLSLLENSPVGIYTVDGFYVKSEKNAYPDLAMRLKIGLYCFSPNN